MENGAYTIASGAVEVEFKADERIVNLPHVYLSHIAINFDVAPEDAATFSVAVVSESGLEIKVVELSVIKEVVVLHEFSIQLPLVRGDILKMVYPKSNLNLLRMRRKNRLLARMRL